jgi:hypothetical protein
VDSPEFASAPKELDRLLKTVANVHALPELVRKLSPLKQPKEKRLFAPVRAEPASNQICPSGRTETTRNIHCRWGLIFYQYDYKAITILYNKKSKKLLLHCKG